METEIVCVYSYELSFKLINFRDLSQEYSDLALLRVIPFLKYIKCKCVEGGILLVSAYA